MTVYPFTSKVIRNKLSVRTKVTVKISGCRGNDLDVTGLNGKEDDPLDNTISVNTIERKEGKIFMYG